MAALAPSAARALPRVVSPFPSGPELLGDVWKGEWYPAHCYKIPAIAVLNSVLLQVASCPTAKQIEDPNARAAQLRLYHEQLGDVASTVESAQKQVAFFLHSVQATALALQKQAEKRLVAAGAAVQGSHVSPSKKKKWFWGKSGEGQSSPGPFPPHASTENESSADAAQPEDAKGGMFKPWGGRSRSFSVPGLGLPRSPSEFKKSIIPKSMGSGSAAPKQFSKLFGRARTETHAPRDAKDCGLAIGTIGKIMENMDLASQGTESPREHAEGEAAGAKDADLDWLCSQPGEQRDGAAATGEGGAQQFAEQQCKTGERLSGSTCTSSSSMASTPSSSNMSSSSSNSNVLLSVGTAPAEVFFGSQGQEQGQGQHTAGGSSLTPHVSLPNSSSNHVPPEPRRWGPTLATSEAVDVSRPPGCPGQDLPPFSSQANKSQSPQLRRAKVAPECLPGPLLCAEGQGQRQDRFLLDASQVALLPSISLDDISAPGNSSSGLTALSLDWSGRMSVAAVSIDKESPSTLPIAGAPTGTPPFGRTKSARHPNTPPMFCTPPHPSAGSTSSVGAANESPWSVASTAPGPDQSMTRSLSRRLPRNAYGVPSTQEAGSSRNAFPKAESPLGPSRLAAKSMQRSSTMQHRSWTATTAHSPHSNTAPKRGNKKSSHERLLDIMSSMQFSWVGQGQGQDLGGAHSPAASDPGIPGPGGAMPSSLRPRAVGYRPTDVAGGELASPSMSRRTAADAPAYPPQVIPNPNISPSLEGGFWGPSFAQVTSAVGAAAAASSADTAASPEKASQHSPGTGPKSGSAKKQQEELLLELLKAAPPIKWSQEPDKETRGGVES